MATAQAKINLDINTPEVVKACGKSWTDDTAPTTFWISGDILYVADCDQDVLDAAVAARNPVSDKRDRDFADLRSKRYGLLKATDWWGVSDRIMSDAEKNYRQALRDLPANTSDPSDPTWPDKP